MTRCSICGCDRFTCRQILWQELIDEWELAADEVEYIDRQQGKLCDDCGASLRVIALSDALLRGLAQDGTMREFVARTFSSAPLKILDINGAATLSDTLAIIPGYERHNFPQVDMQRMGFADEAFDIIIHSDTLEHIPNPIRALEECRRVLKPNGMLCFTIPLLVGRVSRSRAGLELSYHGRAGSIRDDYVVHTEFGADFWTFLMRAGFRSVTINQVEFPSAHAITAKS